VAIPDLRAALRSLPVLTGDAPTFDPRQSPDDPMSMFVEWFDTAVNAGVPEPHAMTLSTVDAAGAPDARTLIVKDVDAAGWHFAVSATSKKGADLAANPVAALTFYWPQLVRQVRVRGTVVPDPPAVASADFLARSAGARALVLLRKQSESFSADDDLDRAGRAARPTRRRPRPGSRRLGLLRRRPGSGRVLAGRSRAPPLGLRVFDCMQYG
jgi:pyridoxamine 5'-phosphate oxidase